MGGGFGGNLQEEMKIVVPSPEISYLWLGEATIGCPTLFFGLVSWGDGISPLRAGTEGSRLAYKRASQHTVATIGLKGLKTSIILLVVEFYYTTTRNKWVQKPWWYIFIPWKSCYSHVVWSMPQQMFLNDLRSYYECARFSSASIKISKSVLSHTRAGFWFQVRTNGRDSQISEI